MDHTTRVLGVDACRGGWVGVVWDGVRATLLAAHDITSLIDAADDSGPTGPTAANPVAASPVAASPVAASPVAVVGIDMPIGLPDTGRRQADVLAREALGSRRSSIFMTPVRPALQAESHAAAVVVNRRLAGEGFSIQAYGLRTKVFEVERYVRSVRRTVLEVHPEVSFARMHGSPLVERKKTWAGAEVRRALLDSAGLHLSGAGALAGVDAGVDDVLDAAAVAWTARRYALGLAESLPPAPEIFSDGRPAAIWV